MIRTGSRSSTNSFTALGKQTPILCSIFFPRWKSQKIILAKDFVSWRVTNMDFFQILDFLIHRVSRWISFRQLGGGGVVETLGPTCLLYKQGRSVHTLHRACKTTWSILPKNSFKECLLKSKHYNKSK
jgi:hypothetical protein